MRREKTTMLTFPGRQETSVTVLPALSTMTASYVAGTIVSTDEANTIVFLVKYIPGDETSIQLKVEGTNDRGVAGAGLTSSSNWFQQVASTVSGGTTTIAPNVYSMTTSGLSNPTSFALLINPIKGTGYRISYKATGGTPTGTLQISAYTGWV